MAREYQENVIEWLTGENVASFTLTQQRYITKARKLAEKYPEDCQILAENEDGSIFGHITLRGVHLSIMNKNMSDERRAELSERMKAMRAEQMQTEPE